MPRSVDTLVGVADEKSFISSNARIPTTAPNCTSASAEARKAKGYETTAAPTLNNHLEKALLMLAELNIKLYQKEMEHPNQSKTAKDRAPSPRGTSQSHQQGRKRKCSVAQGATRTILVASITKTC